LVAVRAKRDLAGGFRAAGLFLFVRDDDLKSGA